MHAYFLVNKETSSLKRDVIMIDRMVLKTVLRCFSVAVVVGILLIFITAFQTDFIMNLREGGKLSSPHRHIEMLGSEEVKTIQEQIKERSHRLEEACSQIEQLPRYNRVGSEYDRGNVHVCAVTKIGSRFMRKFFKKYETLKQPSQKSKQHSIVFVRNPYTRLYSAYIDKLFSANPIFWTAFGREIVNKRQANLNVTCGSDVSFSELVDEVIYRYENNKTIDKHFKLLNRICHFCKVHYDFIGKMETFVRDVTYLSDVVLAINDEGFKDFLQKSLFGGTEKMMSENARNVFGKRLKGIINCNVTLLGALKLTWKRWQIRGFIERRFPFPENSISTFPNFISKSIELHRASSNTTLAASKREFLREAYSTLSNEQKLKLMEMFKPQFEMFGYDPMPDYVFGYQ